MKTFDIPIKDLTRSCRSAFAVIFMFGVPLLVTGMFPRTATSNSPKPGSSSPLWIRADQVPGQLEEYPRWGQADTMVDLIVSILESEDMADLIEISFTSGCPHLCGQPAGSGHSHPPGRLLRTARGCVRKI